MQILNKSAARDFTVLNLTDINMSFDEWQRGSYTCRLLEGTVKEMVDKVSPDLITFTGDFSYGADDICYKNAADLINSFGVPWAFVWGNHDNQCGAERVDELAELMMSYSNCIFEKGDASLGSGNYVIRIDEDNIPIYSLIMMDSHDREDWIDDSGEKTWCWGRLNKNQLDWYEKTAKGINTKIALLTHIPLPAFRMAFSTAWNKEYEPKKVTYDETKKQKYWNEGYKNSYGTCYEDICSYPIDSGEFSVISKGGNTELILVGHDHVNSFVIDYKGIKLAYALKTGAGCYWNENLNGGTVIKISKSGASIEHIFVDSKKFM